MKILVTGGTGFLGTALCAALARRGDEVRRLGSRDADLTRDSVLESAAPDHYDQIYHLAAWTQAGDFCLTRAGEQWIVNQRINTNVLSWWHARQPQAKLIFMGTSCSYESGSDLRESSYMSGEPVASFYTYAMTKRMLLQGARVLGQQFGHRWLCAVPSTLYGPGYHTDGRQMHFIFDLIRKIIRGKLYDEPVVLWGDGHQKRELVLVDDFVRILLELVATREDDIFNIGAGGEHSIREFASEICRIVGYPFDRIGFDTTRYVGARSKCLNVEKTRAAFGDLRLTPLAEGLERTVRWFLDAKAYRQAS